MTIKEKLDEAFATDKMVDAIFEFKALTENLFNVLQETISRIDEIASSGNFANVDEKIKAEGVTIRKILNDAKEELDKHQAFLNWQQPETE